MISRTKRPALCRRDRTARARRPLAIALLIAAVLALASPLSTFAQREENDRSERRSRESRVSRPTSGSGRTGSTLDRSSSRDRTTRTSRNERESRVEPRDKPAKAAASANVGAAGQPATGAAAAASTRARATAITGAARESIASRSPSTSIRFDYKIETEQPVLYFHPPNIQLIEANTEQVALVLHNPRRVEADHLLAAIQYDPMLLRLRKLDIAPIRDFLDSEPLLQFDPQRGVLSIEAYFSRPIALHRNPLLFLTVEALQPVPSTEIRFRSFPFGGRRDAIPSGLYAGRRNILGQSRVPDDGVIGLGVEVLPDPESELEVEATTLAQEIARSADPIVFGRGARGGIVLRLVPASRQINVGDEVDVEVEFLNPARSNLDALRLIIEYDPMVLEVLDTDEGNSITRGINIGEGSRALFPFDYHVANEANNTRGRIEYRIGMTGDIEWPRQGTLATIRFRAKRPSRATEISFVPPDKVEAGTVVQFIGRDVLGSPDDPEDAMEGTALRVMEGF